MAEEADPNARLSRLEQDFVALSSDVRNLANAFGSFVQEQRDFRSEWRKSKEAEAAAAIRDAEEQARAGRLSMPQIVGMGASIAAVTALCLGGLMWMITTETGRVRLDTAAQVGQVGQQINGIASSLQSTQTAVQVLQRDAAADRVRIGLVEQSAAYSRDFVQSAHGYDAIMARHEERISALQQAIRDIAARHGTALPPPGAQPR
jgi:hypothetical protein